MVGADLVGAYFKLLADTLENVHRIPAIGTFQNMHFEVILRSGIKLAVEVLRNDVF
jgi:hypothetical protein